MLKKLGTHNKTFCGDKNKDCPCLTCKNDYRTADPVIDTKCCNLVNHRLRCSDCSPCVDYIAEDEDEI